MEVDSSSMGQPLSFYVMSLHYDDTMVKFYAGHIPVVALNYSMLAKDGTYSRDSVELCIKEILLAMSHYLFTRKSVQLDFCGVGRLFVKELRVKMKFFRDFIRKLDVDGKLENVFRPQSTKSDISVMTNPFPSRCTTTDNFLPR